MVFVTNLILNCVVVLSPNFDCDGACLAPSYSEKSSIYKLKKCLYFSDRLGMKSIILITLLLATISLHAQLLPAEDNSAAILQTQQVLTNTTKREAALDNDKARTADQNVGITSMGNQNVKNDIYGVSSELVPWLSEQGQGDASSMQKLLQEAQSNPQAIENFYRRMPAAQQEKIKNISQQIESLRGSATKTVQPTP